MPAAAFERQENPCQSWSPLHPSTGIQPLPRRPRRDAPGRDEADPAVNVGIEDILLRRDGGRGRRQELRHRARPGEIEQRIGGPVVVEQRRRRQRQHHLVGGAGARTGVDAVRQARPIQITGPCRVTRTGRISGSWPRTAIRSSRDWNGRGPSGVGSGRNPAGSTRSTNTSSTSMSELVMPHAIASLWPRITPREPGSRGARERPFGGDDVHQIPGRRQRERHMRIIGEDGRAARGPLARQHPGV